MATTTTTTCITLTTTGGTILCTEWQSETSGTLLIDDAAPLQVDVLNTNLNVTVTNTVDTISSNTDTGAQLVQIDPFTYPIPVIDQGTAPTEIILGSGATLSVNGEVQVNQEQLDNFGQRISTTTLEIFISIMFLFIIYHVFRRLFTRFFKKFTS